MARFLFPRFKAELLRKTLDQPLNGTTLLRLYAYDNDADPISPAKQFLSDVAPAALEAGPITMTTVAVADDATVTMDNFTIPGFTGDTVEGLLYTMQHTALGQDLLVYYDDDGDFVPSGASNNVVGKFASYVMRL